jgi:mitotic spindle assembly checkpoint protein MAD1
LKTESSVVVPELKNVKPERVMKYVHFKDNPVNWEIEKYQEEFKRLTEENKKLVARVQLLKQGNGDVTRMVDDEISKTEMIDTLQQELDFSKKKQQIIMDAYKKTSKDFREVVYLLTGYR